MSEACCTALTSTGRPCAAHPLPGGDRCLFHDPAHQQSLTESRSKGGTTPRRRRTRRYPLLLDYKQIAELLSELFVDALNDPAAHDPQRLRALTGLSSVLLKAVGRPKNTYETHGDRTEPAVGQAHLLRVYPPELPDLATLLAADAEIEAEAQFFDPSNPSNPSDPSEAQPYPELLNTQMPEPPASTHGGKTMSAGGDRSFGAPPESGAGWKAGYDASPFRIIPDQPRQQHGEQDGNRSRTGASAMDSASPHGTPGSLVGEKLVADGYAQTDTRSAAAGPSAAASSPSPSVSPCLRGETPSSTTLSVPGVPVLISIRRVPGPFG